MCGPERSGYREEGQTAVVTRTLSEYPANGIVNPSLNSIAVIGPYAATAAVVCDCELAVSVPLKCTCVRSSERVVASARWHPLTLQS